MYGYYCVTATLVSTFLLAGAPTPGANPSEDLAIASIELEHSNPSMGPHETRDSYTLWARDFPKEVKRLLTETQVNGAASLETYLRLRKRNDRAAVAKIDGRAPTARRSEGSTVSTLRFTLADGSSLELADLRGFTLKGYYEDTFVHLLVEKGSKSTIGPEPEPGPRDLVQPAPEVGTPSVVHP